MCTFAIKTGKRTLWPRFNRKETTVGDTNANCGAGLEANSLKMGCHFNSFLKDVQSNKQTKQK